jgi:hypothetical protein
MRLIKALKKAKLLAGEIAELESKILSSNTYTVTTLASGRTVTQGKAREGQEANVLFEQLLNKKEELANLKGAIGVANAPVRTKIAQLGELKGLLTMLKRLNCDVDLRFNTKNVLSSDGTRTVPVEEKIEQLVFITAAAKDAVIAKTTKEITELEEELNNFNFTTDIAVQE